MAETVEIRWHGRGGQGTVTAAKVLADACLSGGRYVQAFPEYGPERAGAPLRAYNRVSSKELRMHCPVLNPDIVTVVDATLLDSINIAEGRAGRAGAKPTGHGSTRSYSNLVINPGDTPYAEMLKGIHQGLLVHEFLGLGQGNPINGEFSVNLFLDYKIEDGEIVGRVKDVMLAGNALHAIQDIAVISKEREWVSGDFAWLSGLFPYLQVNKLSVVAK